MRTIALVITVCAVAGCNEAEKPLSKGRADKGGWTVSLLFEQDGCRAYEADADGYRAFYFVRCPDKTTAAWSRPRTVGKTQVLDDFSVDTTNR